MTKKSAIFVTSEIVIYNQGLLVPMFSRTENTIEEIKVKSIESGSKTANKIEPSSVDLRAAQANRNITTKNGKNNKKISPMKMPNFGLIDCRNS